MSLIRFDFGKANSQINEIDELAGKIEKIASVEYQEMIRQLRTAWKGAGSDRFIMKGEQLQASMQEAVSDAKMAADAYRSGVKRAKRAEAEAIRLAQEKNT